MTIATPATIDPLKAFMAEASAERGRPIPLISTTFDIDIDGGLAIVVTKRVFRNDEAESIEATITFPVPVHAVLFDLQARIDGRTVKARAQRRAQARELYEDAIERGKAAVLHEEILRGIHMVSVAHLGPGGEIEVTTTWAATMSFVGDEGQLRIPLTVGDLYGRSGQPDSDDLLTGGPVQAADLTVRCASGAVAVRGVRLDDGRARIALNSPIDLAVTHATPRDLHGAAADGREVVLRVSPRQDGDMALNVAVLVDHSGSMEQACSTETGPVTKHEAVIAGLRSIAERLGDDDVVDLWEFDERLAHVGSSHDPASRKRGCKRLLSLIARLTHPRGGTEIGAALSGTMDGSNARDVLLVTDGQSYALDVQELARKGRRVTVVLVGEDSLEANVGHLAALSGGDIFVASGGDTGDVLAAAVGSLRAPSERPGPIGASLDRVRSVRGNAVLEAEWRPATGPVSGASQGRAVAAVAASLALPALDEERAALLAEAEGLVTHLTSLVLVDDAGAVQEGVPATRKIALPSPGRPGVVCMSASMRVVANAAPPACPDVFGRIDLAQRRRRRPPAAPARLLADVRLDWDTSPNKLLAGDLSALDPQDALVIEEAAARPQVADFAKRNGIDPVVLVVALVAQRHAPGNRSAARIARTILGDESMSGLDQIMHLLALA